MYVSKKLRSAREALYDITGGSRRSGDVRLAQMTTQQRIKYFRSSVFRDYVASEPKAFLLKDVDKTQAAGDVFTFMFHERVKKGWFTKVQLDGIAKYLRSLEHAQGTGPEEVVRLFNEKLDGGKGIGLLDFWSNAYWPSQFGLTHKEKLRQVSEFAPHYAAKVYPGVREENLALADAGVEVVIVSNGDQELAMAVAPILGIKPENAVGSNLIYCRNGRATGVVHTYEIMNDPKWEERPQPGKALSFHYWLHMNRRRFGWNEVDEDKYVIIGRDGDSAASDGGMMILMNMPATLGNFMVDTPGEPGRIEKFYHVAAKYGFTKGQFITLKQKHSRSGAKLV
jgi:hypothetical protein